MLKSLAPIKNLFFPAAPAASELAKQELAEAERALLKAQTDREYADAMVQCHQRRISRLQGIVAAHRTAANDTPNQLAIRRAA